MGTKIELAPLGQPLNSSFTTELNNGLDSLADEFDEVVYRDGSQSMLGGLNMNSNRIYNLPAPATGQEPMRYDDVIALIEDLTGVSVPEITGIAAYPTRATLAGDTSLAGAAVALTEPGREGIFVLMSASDYLTRFGIASTAAVAADTAQGMHIARASDPTGASAVWVRAFEGPINVQWFGAKGDGTTNNTAAFKAASAVVQAHGGGELIIPKGVYIVGTQTFQGTLLDGVTPAAYGPSEILTIKNCTKSIKISGYGAVLKTANGLRYGSFDRTTGAIFNPGALPFVDYDYYAYPYRGMINVEGNESVTIEGLELDGNSANLIIGGYWGDSAWQLEGHGIYSRNNNVVNIVDVHTHDHPADGLTIASSGITEGSAAKPLHLVNVRSFYNGRQGLSLTGGKSVTIDNCDFSMTGQRVNIGLGTKLQSTPGCGIDVEAEGTLVRDVTVISSRFLGNWRRGVIASSGYSKGVTFENCTIECAVIGRWRYHFDNCLFIGFTNFATPLTNEYLAGTPAITEQDGLYFHKCRFVYDDTLSGTGTMIDSTQSAWNEAAYARFVDCSIRTGTYLLPTVVKTPLSLTSACFENTDWISTNSGAAQINGFFRGQNNITNGGSVSIGLGVNSRIDTGEIYVNGVGQGGATFGYVNGNGGTVVQTGNKGNTVALNKPVGEITLHNQSLGADSTITFEFDNTVMKQKDLLILNHVAGGTLGGYTLNGRVLSDGAALIDVHNVTTGALAEAIVIRFALVGGSIT